MNYYEIIASILGVISVWLSIKQNIWCWPTGIVMVVLYVFIFYQAHLYSGVVLHIIYIFLQIYGWHHWLYGGKDNKSLTISHIKIKELIFFIIITILGILILGFIMENYTTADLAYWDAIITVVSLIGQWFMARKIFECWFIWIFVNILAVCIYGIKGLYLTAILYAIFLVMAFLGLAEWRKYIETNAVKKS